MAGRGSHLIVDEVLGLLETKTTRELSKKEEGDLAGLPNNGGAHTQLTTGVPHGLQLAR